MDFLENRQMEGVEPIDQARRAIIAVLGYCKRSPRVGYYVGIGTQSFDLLTEALATIEGKPVKEIRETWRCPNPEAPPSTRDLIEAEVHVEALLALCGQSKATADHRYEDAQRWISDKA